MFLLLPSADPPPLAYPHPVITEVLYAVPTRSGDANRDGKRDTAGDEFVELINSHDRPINLKGYTLCDSGEGKSRFKFTFPAVALEPGQVAVVFNGHDASIPGAVGDATHAPVGGNDYFSGALVFTARAASSRTSWANKSDYVLLLAPNGAALECVYWGDEKKPPQNCPVMDQAPAVMRGSVQRARVLPPDTPADIPLNPAADKPTENPAPPAVTGSQPQEPASSAPGTSPAKAPAGEKPPATSKPKLERPVYKRKPAETAEPKAKPKPDIPFTAFEGHPSLPGSLFGRPLDPEEGDEGILFSPGVYPLDRLKDRNRRPQQEPTPGDTSGQAPATVPGREASPRPTERTNSGDPR